MRRRKDAADAAKAGKQPNERMNAGARVAASPSPPKTKRQPKLRLNAKSMAAASSSPDGGEKPMKLLDATVQSASPPSIADVCTALQELQRFRVFYQREIVRHQNAAGALVRRMLNWNPAAPEKVRKAIRARALAIVARAMAQKPQKPRDQDIAETLRPDLEAIRLSIGPPKLRIDELEAEMERQAARLPAAAFVARVRGFSLGGLATIIGETGDLSDGPHPDAAKARDGARNYPNFRHVWKRLGLAPYDGRAGATWRRLRGLSAEQWKAFGYSPLRRAQIFAYVAEPLAKCMCEAAGKSQTEFGRPRNRYGEVYVARREHTKATHPEWSKKHAQLDALRVVTKALIADLWKDWRGEAMA